MRKYKTIIVDDEGPARGLLSLHASQVEEIDLIDTCQNALEAKKLLSAHDIDIMLLDVQMDDLTGLDLLKMLKKQLATILTSAYSEYALEGYELDVVDYLVKPIAFDRFYKAIDKAINYVQRDTQHSSPQLRNEKGSQDSVFLKIGHKLVKLQFKESQYLKSYGEHVKVNTSSEMYLAYKTMDSFEVLLPESKFYRIHRS